MAVTAFSHLTPCRVSSLLVGDVSPSAKSPGSSMLSSSGHKYCTCAHLKCYSRNEQISPRNLSVANIRLSSRRAVKFLPGSLFESCKPIERILMKAGKDGEWGLQQRRDVRRRHMVGARLLDPVIFDASKLAVDYTDGMDPADVAYPRQLIPRCYTLTHHDVTAELHLSIGSSINVKQLSGWYTRLLRDEIVAEWRVTGEEAEQLSLHVHCHISGAHFFLAPAALRDWIFRREMPLVLQAFMHGDEVLFDVHPELELATVWVHYHSLDPRYNRADCWGPLCLAATSRESSLAHVIMQKPGLESIRLQGKQALQEESVVAPSFSLDDQICDQISGRIRRRSLVSLAEDHLSQAAHSGRAITH